MIKVLVVDNHELLREGIKKLLEDSKDIEVVGDAVSGEQALEMVREKQPNVVLMEVKMPGLGGLETTRRLARLDPSIKVIAVTTYNKEPYPSRMLQAGARGYLTKGCSVAEMVNAVRKVNAGKRHICADVAQQLAIKHISDEAPSSLEVLSDRELQVMLMIASGDKVQDISDKLFLSPKTVNAYRYRLFEKLKVNNDVKLTHIAFRYGLLDGQSE